MSSVQHATLTLERTYPVPRSRVFAAWADPEIKARWFDEPGAEVSDALVNDFREGGLEKASGRFDGRLYTYEAVYRDIVTDERIATTYEMGVDGRRMSVSVATVELHDEGDATRLAYTEQCAYLDDLDRPEWREQGTNGQLDRLDDVLIVTDHDAAVAWYGRLLDRPPDEPPMDSLAEWQLTETGWLQVVADPARAGSGAVTLRVDDLDAHAATTTCQPASTQLPDPADVD